MNSNGQNFLQELASSPSDTFEKSFSVESNRLGLGAVLNRNELTLLCEAAQKAATCNRALNSHGQFAPGAVAESLRARLEWEYLIARDMLFASPGWQTLPDRQQREIEHLFLRVSVADDRLMP